MSMVVIRTGLEAADGGEQNLWEYVCDYDGCPRAAQQVMGVSLELRKVFAVCAEHAEFLKRASKQNR